MNSEKPLPMQYSLMAGAIAGVSEILAMYPLVGNSEYKSIADCFSKMIKKEGLGSLYRGILPPIMVEAPKRAIKFGANEQYGALYKKHFGFENGKALAVATGVSAGMTEAVIVALPDLIKIRMQDKNNAGKYGGAIDVLKTMIRDEGSLSLLRGLEATIWRHALWNGGYFGSISFIKSAIPPATTKERTLLNNFIAGSIGGTVGTILNTPFDVAKTRIQSDMLKPYKYSSAIPSIATIFREEGPRALYKGFVPKVLRLGPGGGILLVVFDFISTYIRKNVL